MGGCDKTTPAPDHGRHQHGPARRLSSLPGRCSAATGRGQLARQRQRRVELLGRQAGGARSARPRLGGIEDGIARSPGHCMTMGTASTMASVAEALGLTLPGAACIPAADSGQSRLAAATGTPRRRDGLGGPAALRAPHAGCAPERGRPPSLALGGSTNAVIHLVALAGRRAACRCRSTNSTRPLAHHARPRQHQARRPVPDGGLLLRGRPARVARAGSATCWISTCATVTGHSLGENIAGARRLQRPGHRAARPTAVAGRRARGSSRQPGPGRRGHQARRRRTAAPSSYAGPPSSSRLQRHDARASTIRRWP